MDAVETQEAGTGKWFPVIAFIPGDETQYAAAKEMAGTLEAIGLYARVTGFKEWN